MTTTDDTPSTPTAPAALPGSDHLEAAIEGMVANARIGWSLTRLRRAAERAEWDDALEAVATLAERVAPQPEVGPAGWRDVLVAAAWVGVRAGDVTAFAELLSTYGRRAWSGETTEAMPWQLADVFAQAEADGQLAAGESLGAIIDADYPRCPLGAYATAHFAELSAGPGDRDLLATVADTFEHAAAVAQALGVEATARRARLRAGYTLLRAGLDRDRGRKLLRAIALTELNRDDRLAWAVALAKSPFWLDRVRACDAVLDLRVADITPEDDALAADLAHAARVILEAVPVCLEPAEEDRALALIEQCLPKHERSDWRGRLKAAQGARALLDAPADRLDRLAEALARHPSPAGWANETAQSFYRGAGQALGGHASPGVEVDARLPLGGAIVEALSAVTAGDDAALAHALAALTGADDLSAHPEHDALALVWPPLLERMRALWEGSSDDPDASIRQIFAIAPGVIGRWILTARAPSYGWWLLAAHLLGAKLRPQAQAAALKAIDDGESVDGELELRVLLALVDHALQNGTDDDLLFWLEQTERVRRP